MGYRLSKIYTRTGDNGTTGLSDGSRVDKDSLRIAAIGSVDELNSQLGVICSEEDDWEIQELVTRIQHRLFDMGGELSMPDQTLVQADAVTWLEQKLDLLNEELAPLEDFILPGGCRSAATCHVARSLCRRAERDMVHLSRKEPISPVLAAYLNRLSDFLFVLCRHLNKLHGHNDILWQHTKLDEKND